MNAIFMNSKNSRTSDPHRSLLNLIDQINLKRSDKYIDLSNLSIQYSWKNIKKSYKNNKFIISVPTCNEEFKLPDGSYSVSDIKDCFEHILKKHGEKTDNPSVKTYINKKQHYIQNKYKVLSLTFNS